MKFLMTMDLEADLRAEILRCLPIRDPNDESLTSRLKSMLIRDLLVRFLNWRDRFVHAQPRTVQRSMELLANPIYLRRRNDVSLICGKLAMGQDVGPHLSRNVKFGYELPKSNRKPGRDLDLLLNDWGIHHLHLSSTIEWDGFVSRTDEILFAILHPGFAYMLDIMTHNDWENDHLVHVAIKNWPLAKLFHPLNGVFAGGHIPSEDRKVLRRAGVSTFINIDGISYMSGTGGMSAARTTGRASIQSAHILRSIRRYTESPANLIEDFNAEAKFREAIWSESPRFRVKSANFASGFALCIEEETTGRLLRLE